MAFWMFVFALTCWGICPTFWQSFVHFFHQQNLHWDWISAKRIQTKSKKNKSNKWASAWLLLQLTLDWFCCFFLWTKMWACHFTAVFTCQQTKKPLLSILFCAGIPTISSTCSYFHLAAFLHRKSVSCQTWLCLLRAKLEFPPKRKLVRNRRCKSHNSTLDAQ